MQRSLLGQLILYFGVHTVLGLIVNPLTNEQLVLVVVEVGSLAFTLVIDPMTFEVISISFGKHAVTVTLSLVPLTLINVLVRVDHATLTLRHSIDPVAVVTVPILVEEGATAVLLVLEPVASVLTSEFFGLHTPVGALAVALVQRPHAFVLVSALVVLNSESFLAIVAPVADVLA